MPLHEDHIHTETTVEYNYNASHAALICEVENDEDGIHVIPDKVETKGITWYKATFLIVNAALGAGLLNFPQAFDQTGGIVSGNVAHIILVFFSLGSLLILAICGAEENSKTYQEVVKSLCGSRWGAVSSVCIVLYCFFTCITFIIIIGDQFDRAFASFYGVNFCRQWYMNRRFTMVASSLPLIVPSCLKRIDGMELMSYVGVGSILYLALVIFTEMVSGHYAEGEIRIWDVDVLSFFNVVPTICFGYQCHVSSVPILSCLKKRDRPAMTKACCSAIFICFLVYTLSANCGYLTFGSLISSDVLLDYDARKIYVLIAVLLLAIKAWTTYPILMFCVREAVCDLYLGVRNMNLVEVQQSEPLRRKVVAALLWFSTILFAVFIPGLGTIIKVLGSLAGLFILAFPGMCLLNRNLNRNHGAQWGLRNGSQLWVAFVLVVVGVFTFGLALAMGVDGLLSASVDVPLCVVSGW